MARHLNRAGRPCLNNAEILKEIDAILSTSDCIRLFWSFYRRLCCLREGSD
jgi:hypothetical protein